MPVLHPHKLLPSSSSPASTQGQAPPAARAPELVVCIQIEPLTPTSPHAANHDSVPPPLPRPAQPHTSHHDPLPPPSPRCQSLRGLTNQVMTLSLLHLSSLTHQAMTFSLLHLSSLTHTAKTFLP
eukprot:scaffold60515_cov19-Tisochrysis_lutea.AAC.1